MNLVVNARDAMPEGGRLDVVTARERVDGPRGGAPPGRGERGELGPARGARYRVRDAARGDGAALRAVLHDEGPLARHGTRAVDGVRDRVPRPAGTSSWTARPARAPAFACCCHSPSRPPRRRVRAGRQAPCPVGTETLLLVEDEAGVRELIRDFLLRCGYEVLEAGDVQRALELFGEHGARIALLITDIVMPQMNGRVLAERLRAEQPDLKVLYISGYTDESVLTPNAGATGGVPAEAVHAARPGAQGSRGPRGRAGLRRRRTRGPRGDPVPPRQRRGRAAHPAAARRPRTGRACAAGGRWSAGTAGGSTRGSSRALTTTSNLVPFAWLDVLIALALVIAGVWIGRPGATRRDRRWRRVAASRWGASRPPPSCTWCSCWPGGSTTAACRSDERFGVDARGCRWSTCGRSWRRPSAQVNATTTPTARRATWRCRC
jgi:CheY-like chemotaxis protein